MIALFLACAAQEEVQKPPKEEVKRFLHQDPVFEIVEEEKKEQNLSPVIDSVSFVTENPTVKDQVKVAVVAKDPEGLPLRYDYVWKVNGKSYHSETREFLRKTKVKRGDNIEVTVIATDGVLQSEKSAQTTVGNSSPEWDPDPRNLKDINGFRVNATDPDGDSITYKLEGAPNGMSISPTGTLSYVGSEQEPGGNYTVSVIAEDPQKAQVRWQFAITLSAGSKAKK